MGFIQPQALGGAAQTHKLLKVWQFESWIVWEFETILLSDEETE